MDNYISKLTPAFIEAHSRTSVKIKNDFYTFEYVERREIPKELYEDNQIDLLQERKILWEDCNSQVDKQVEQIVEMYK